MAGEKSGDAAKGTLLALARAVLAADSRALPAPAMRQAQLLLLDTIGCGVAGWQEHVAQELAHVVVGATPECAIIGRARKSDVLSAVLLNGVLIRVLDLNDYVIGESKGQPETAGHPSDNIPVALALGAARARSGREVLAAIVIGYEIYARLQDGIDRGGAWDGVTVSGLVAPAMAGRLMGLDETRLAHAMALGGTRSPTPAIVRRGDISAAKSLANALVAQSGVQAALLAESGLTGPLALLDDARGLGAIFARISPAQLAAPIDGAAIMRAHVKAYPCVNTAQSVVATALKLHAELKGDSKTIQSIRVTMADYAVIARQQQDAARIRPRTREAADHSFHFLTAVALADGRFDTGSFENERWRDPHIVALMERIALHCDATLNALAPGAYPCAMRARLADGREISVEIPYPPGFSRPHLDPVAIVEKFHATTAPFLDASARGRIVDAALALDSAPSTEQLDMAISREAKA